MSRLIEAMGYKPKRDGDVVTFHHAARRPRHDKPARPQKINEDSPFAVLKRLK